MIALPTQAALLQRAVELEDERRGRGGDAQLVGRLDEARAAYTTALDIATAQGALRSVEPARAALEELGIRN